VWRIPRERDCLGSGRDKRETDRRGKGGKGRNAHKGLGKHRQREDLDLPGRPPPTEQKWGPLHLTSSLEEGEKLLCGQRNFMRSRTLRAQSG